MLVSCCFALTRVLPSAALLAAVLCAVPAVAEPVDLELVLATDTSGSIDQEEAVLQRRGVADAFANPDIVKAIQAGALGKIAVVYIDWSRQDLNTIVVDWTVIKDKASSEGFAQKLIAAPPTFGRRTSISSAISLGVLLLESNNYEGTRRVIDISGDGPNNYGESLAPVREAAIAKGITINGLPIVTEDAAFQGRGYFPDIDQYYARCVIGGPAAFVVVAHGFRDFATAIRHKLVLELSDLSPGQAPRKGPALIKVAAAARPVVPNAPSVIRPPAKRETNCDVFGFGGYGGFGRFR